jgi:phytoene dehydrogenase-like protein
LNSTRREILAALLGAGAFAACKSAKEPPRYDGRFVGPSFAEGHKLRGRVPPEWLAKVEDAGEIPILILGGGASGLVAGWQLLRAGQERFKLLELEPTIGGTATSGSEQGLRFPWGAHYVPAPAAEQVDMLDLFRETGTLIGFESGRPVFDETHLCAAPKERLFFRGFWQEGLFPWAGVSDAERAELRRFRAEVDRWIAFRDDAGRRAFTIPVDRSSDEPELRALDRISFDEWCAARKIESSRVRWFLEYGCRDDFGGELATTSAWAGLHYFAARTERPGEESAEFLTWPAGNGFLVDHLASRIGAARIETSTLVVGIEPDSDGKRALVTALARNGSGARRAVRWTAERVIFALPSMLRARLLSRWDAPQYAPRYAPWLVANVHLKDRPRSRGFEQSWDNVVYGSRSLGYVVATHQIPRSRGPTVWTWYLPFTAPDERASRNSLLALGWEEAASVAFAELSSCHLDFDRLVERIDVMRWGHGMVRPIAGSIFAPERLQASAPVGPIHFAHTDLSGLALFEEAFAQGTRAAREVLRSLS